MCTMQSVLVIDEGNTRTKVGFFPEGAEKVEEVWMWPGRISDDLAHPLPYHLANTCIISTVHKEKLIPPGLAENQVFFADHTSPWPFSNAYETPETLGIDRLAAVAGGVFHFPKQDFLVIDAGTCITYEWFTEGRYQGGIISPGRMMRARAMHQFTSKLPMTELEVEINVPGKNTQAALAAGILAGTLHEFKGFYRDFTSNYPEGKVIITGGDSSGFENIAECPIFAAPNLILEGLAYTMRQWGNTK